MDASIVVFDVHRRLVAVDRRLDLNRAIILIRNIVESPTMWWYID